MIYIIVLLYTLVLVYSYDIKGYRKNFKLHYRILLVISIAIVGFSYRLGMDTVGYMNYYDRVDSNILYTLNYLIDLRYEPVPELVFSICKHFWDDFTLVQIVVGIFVNTTVFWFLKKYSPAFFFSVFLYFIFQYWNVNFEIKRESIAVALFLIAIDCILKDNSKKAYIKYFLISLLMLLCHKFAFITLIYPLCLRFRVNKVSIISLTAAFFIVFFSSSLSENIFSNINFLFSFFNTEDVVRSYLDSDIYGSNNVSFVGYVFSIAIPIYLIYSVRNECDEKILSLALLFIFVSILSSQIFIFYRIANYLYFFIFIVYSNAILPSRHGGFIKARHLALLLLLIITIYGKTHKEQYIRYLPYNSVFEKTYNSERESEYQRLGDIMNY